MKTSKGSSEGDVVKTRLQSFLGRAGVSSRRGAAAVILAGRVSVNGAPVYEKGFRVDPERDTVTFDGTSITGSAKQYFIVHKPKRYISTVRDPFADKTVLDLVPKEEGRLYPVGRLDKDTTGIILLTNDGDLAYGLTHPKFEIAKVYRVRARGLLDTTALTKIRKGVELDDGVTAEARVSNVACGENETTFDLEIHEGRKRQVRRMLDAVGHPVVSLERIEFAGLRLGAVSLGGFRRLTKKEVARLKTLCKKNNIVGGNKHVQIRNGRARSHSADRCHPVRRLAVARDRQGARKRDQGIQKSWKRDRKRNRRPVR